MIILMPAWPMWMKKIIFYISLYLLIILFGLLAFRGVVYLIFRGFGISLWILPEIMNDNYYVFYSCERNKEISIIEGILRLVLLIFVGYVSFNLYQAPETFGNINISYKNFISVRVIVCILLDCINRIE